MGRQFTFESLVATLCGRASVCESGEGLSVYLIFPPQFQLESVGK